MSIRLLLSITSILFFFSTKINALCVHEKEIIGMNLDSLRKSNNIFIKMDDDRYLPIENFVINPLQKYIVQYSDMSQTHDDSTDGDYNKKYIEYYNYSRMQKFMSETHAKFSNIDHEIVVVGKV